MSWTNSTPSSTTPIATAIVDHPTNVEKWFALACIASLIGHPSDGSESISDQLDRHLLDVAIGAIILGNGACAEA